MKRALIASLVAASIAASSGCDNAQQRQEKYLTQGKSYLEEGNIEKARISFKNALQINPENVEAKLKFAEVLERADDYKAAYGQYLSVLDKDPNNAVALEHQGKILMMANENDKAMENAEKLLSTNGADFLPGLLLKAAVLARTNMTSEALKLAEKLVVADPKNLDASALLSSLYIRQADYVSAEKELNKAITLHPSVSGLKLILVDVLRKEGKSAQVETILRGLTKDEPDQLPHFTQLAKFLQIAGRSDEALAVLQQFVTSHGEDKSAKLALVQLTDVAKGVNEGDRVLAELIQKNPAVYELQFAQIQRLLAGKKKDEANAGLQAIIDRDKSGNDGLKARLLLAQIKAADKDIDGAKALINEITTLNASDLGALALRGRIALQEHRYPDAISDLRAVVKERADDVQSMLLLASAHIQNNESELAVELLQNTVKQYPRQRDARLMLADLLSKKGDSENAILQYKALLAQKPDDAQILVAIAKLYQTVDKRDELADVASKMLANKETMAAGFYYQGVVKIKQNKHEEARELFEKSLAISPSAIEPVSALVQSYLAQKQSKQAVARLDKLISSQKESSTFYNLRAEAMLAGKDVTGAQTNLKKAIELSPAWWVPYRTLAGLLWYLQDKPGAERVLKQGIEATSNNPLLRMELASQLQRNGSIDESIAVYQQMIDDGQDGDAVINNFAMLLTLKSDAASLDAAKNYSDKLAQSKNPLFLDTAGWVRFKRGEYEAALPILKRAAELAPKHSQIRYHLGVAYFKNNQRQEAKDNLATALQGENPFEGREDAQRVLQELQKESQKG